MDKLIDELIALSFAKDIGWDHTTLSSIPADAMGKQRFIIKEKDLKIEVEVLVNRCI